MIFGFALREANPIRCLRARDDDFLDSQFASRFDDVVGAQHISAEAFAVGDEQVARIGGEVDHGVGRLDAGAGGKARVFVMREVEVRRQGVENLARIGEVGFQGVHDGIRKRSEVDVEDGVAARKKVGDAVALSGWLGGDVGGEARRDVRPALPDPPVKTMRFPVVGAAIATDLALSLPAVSCKKKAGTPGYEACLPPAGKIVMTSHQASCIRGEVDVHHGLHCGPRSCKMVSKFEAWWVNRQRLLLPNTALINKLHDVWPSVGAA